MIGILFSGGKDSTYVIYKAIEEGKKVKCLITMKSQNKESYMFHTATINITKMQAKAMKIPIMYFTTKGEKEKELKDLEKAIKKAKTKYKIKEIGVGALASEYQKARVKKICDKLKLKMFAPLWKKNQKQYLEELVQKGFEIKFTGVGAYGLTEAWLGKNLDERTIKELIKLNEKYGIHIGGEGGEYETIVLNAPIFKQKIQIIKTNKKMNSENSGRIEIIKAKLIEKTNKQPN
ncbi:MAG: diphthine--ammonia ligase [Candidatus Diapherotrites archaeon]